MMFEITRKDAVSLCQGLGFATADGWKRARLVEKLSSIIGMYDKSEFAVDEEIVKDETERERLNDLLLDLVASERDFDVVKTPAAEKVKEDEGGDQEEVPVAVETEADGEKGGVPEGEKDQEKQVDEDGVGDSEEGGDLGTLADESTDEQSVQQAATPKKKAKSGKKKSAKIKGGKKKPGVRKDAKGGRPKIMGSYSAGPFVRWLGRQGVSLDGAKAILEGEGITHLKEASIGWELKERREKNKPADVLDRDAEDLKGRYPEVFIQGKE